MKTLEKLANTPIYNDRTTFAEMFEYLLSDGFFWANGEPPNGTEETNAVMLAVLKNLLDAAKE